MPAPPGPYARRPGGAEGAPPGRPQLLSVVDVHRLADPRVVVGPVAGPDGLTHAAVTRRVRRHVHPPVHGEVALEPHGAHQRAAEAGAGVGVLLLDAEGALRRVAGGAGGDADDAPRLAALDDHQDLPGLVDLDVGGRARVPGLDELGAVDLAPARGVEHVAAREAVGLLERHDGVLDLGGEGGADVGDAEAQALESREHALDVGARGAGRQRLGAHGDLGLQRAAVQAGRGRQHDVEGEGVHATQREAQRGLSVLGAGLVRAHDRAAMGDLDDDEAVVGGRRDLDRERGREERDERAVGHRRLGLDGERPRGAGDRRVGGETCDDVAAAVRSEGERVGAGRVGRGRAGDGGADLDRDLLVGGGRVQRAAHGDLVAEDHRRL